MNNSRAGELDQYESLESVMFWVWRTIACLRVNSAGRKKRRLCQEHWDGCDWRLPADAATATQTYTGHTTQKKYNRNYGHREWYVVLKLWAKLNSVFKSFHNLQYQKWTYIKRHVRLNTQISFALWFQKKENFRKKGTNENQFQKHRIKFDNINKRSCGDDQLHELFYMKHTT